MLQNKTPKQKINKGIVLEAIHKNAGLISYIASTIGRTRQHTYRVIERYGLDEELKLERDKVNDIAESNIFTSLRAGDVETSKWYLNRQGRARGYIERVEQEIGGNQDKPIRLVISKVDIDGDAGSGHLEAGRVSGKQKTD